MLASMVPKVNILTSGESFNESFNVVVDAKPHCLALAGSLTYLSVLGESVS